MFTDTSPPDPGLPAPISGSPPASDFQGEDWEARPGNATPHDSPQLRSDPVLSHPEAQEEGRRAVVTGLVLLPPPHPAGPEGPGCASQWAGALRPLALSRGPGGQRRKTCPFDLATPVPASALRSPVVWEASAGSCAHSPSTGSGAPPLFTFILGK